jgi:hypothetical protein
MLLGHPPINGKTVTDLMDSYSNFVPKFDSKLQKISSTT